MGWQVGADSGFLSRDVMTGVGIAEVMAHLQGQLQCHSKGFSFYGNANPVLLDILCVFLENVTIFFLN